MTIKVDATYVKEIEELFQAVIEKVADTGLVSDTGFNLLKLMQRNVASNFYKKDKTK